MTTTYQQLGSQIGELTDQKNAAYGSSFAKSGDFLRLLFPDGIPATRMEDALLLVRIFDKQMRIATDQDAFGESPYQDIAGYGLLGAQLHQEKRATCQGSANGPDAPNPSKETPDFTASSTNEPITTSASATPALEPSQPLVSYSRPLESVPAATVQGIANQNVVALAQSRNKDGVCGCGCGVSRFAECRVISYRGSVTLLFASQACLMRFLAEEVA